MPRTVTFAAPITAADRGRRTITGRLVTFGEEGHTSAGPTVFEGPPAELDASAVRIVHQHDDERPLGRAVELAATDTGVDGRFRIAGTTAGDDALVEAAEGLRDGLSVGAELLADGAEVGADGVLRVAAGGWRLVHVGLVTSPAFTGSRVADVAAQQHDDPDPDPDPDPEPTDDPEVPAVSDHQDNDQQAAEVTAAATPTTDTVTAANPTPQVTVNERERAPITAGGLVQAIVRASQGDPDARDLVTAATGTAQVPGLLPDQYARDVVGIIDPRRPIVDSVERRPLPSTGTKIKVPVRLTKAGVEIVDELPDPEMADSGSTFDWIEADVVTFAGKDTLSVQAIDRSDPSLLDDLLVQFAESYAQQTDEWVAAGLLAGAAASTGADYAEAIVQAIADSAGVVRTAPQYLGLGLTGWSTLKNDRASDGRATFPRLGASNAAGTLTGDPFSGGDVEGLAPRVSLNLDDPSAMFVYPSTALRFYEGAGVAQVRAMQVGTLAWEVGVYGYVARLPKYPTAVRTVALTP